MPFDSAETTPAGVRLRVLPSVGSAVRVAALDAGDDALLVLELPKHLFDADRVRSAMNCAIAALGIELGPRLHIVR